MRRLHHQLASTLLGLTALSLLGLPALAALLLGDVPGGSVAHPEADAPQRFATATVSPEPEPPPPTPASRAPVPWHGGLGISTLYEVEIDPRRVLRAPRPGARLPAAAGRPRRALGDDAIATAAR